MKKILLLIISGLITAWFGFAYYCGYNLRKHPIITRSKVYSIDKGGKGNFGPGVYYNYSIGKDLYKGTDLHGQLKYSIEDLNGKYFPVVYSFNGFWYDSKILITPDDFKQFNLPFPDSLNWVLKYMK